MIKPKVQAFVEKYMADNSKYKCVRVFNKETEDTQENRRKYYESLKAETL
jgi:hypothetical protein